MAAKPRTRKNFLRVVCPRCKHTQVIFGKATTFVKCIECGKVLARPQGGKTQVRAVVTRVFRWPGFK